MKRMPVTHGFEDEREAAAPAPYVPPWKAGFLLMLVALGILLFGLIALYSTTSGARGAAYLIRQALWVFLGMMGAATVNFVGYRRILRYSPYLLAIGAGLLVLPWFFKAVKGAHRWITLPFGIGKIQPSEFVKLFLVMFLAWYIPKRQRQFSHGLKGLVIPGAACGLILVLVLAGKDLGTTILLSAVAWCLFFVAGAKWRYLMPPLLLLPVAPFYLKRFDPERWSRIVTFLNPEAYQSGDGYQLWFSHLALASGNWFGLGFTRSRIKGAYLPESHTDFILAIVGEELGFVALAALIAGYIAFVALAVYISARAKEKEGALLGFGLTLLLAFQAIINIGVVSGAFPTKGMSAPFISYGGSNMIMGLVSIGLLVSIANDKGESEDTDASSGVNILNALRATFNKANARTPEARS